MKNDKQLSNSLQDIIDDNDNLVDINIQVSQEMDKQEQELLKSFDLV